MVGASGRLALCLGLLLASTASGALAGAAEAGWGERWVRLRVRTGALARMLASCLQVLL